MNTLGPAVTSHDAMKELMEAGMNIARLNMSHGDYSEHQERLDLVRSVSKELGLNVAALADLQGPKIRTGLFEKAEGESNGKIDLKIGGKFTITTDDIVGNQERVSTTFKGLPQDCKPGDVILTGTPAGSSVARPGDVVEASFAQGDYAVEPAAGSKLFAGADTFAFDGPLAVQAFPLAEDDFIAYPKLTWADVNGQRVLAGVENGALSAVAFNPADSGEAGLKVLHNWITQLPESAHA